MAKETIGALYDPSKEELDDSFTLYDVKVRTLEKGIRVKPERALAKWPTYFVRKDNETYVFKTDMGFVQLDPEIPQGEEARYVRFKEGSPVTDGPFCRVYKMYDNKTGRTVAGKRILYPTPAQTLNEARMTAHFNHPNIAIIHDLAVTNKWGEGNEEVYMISEWLDGGSLLNWMDGSHSLSDASVVLGQISSAIAEVNDKGFIFADLTPHNVLFDKHGIAKIIDFGISVETDSNGIGFTLGGNSQYAPPEQRWGYNLDRGADIYSFGAVAYFMLTGMNEEFFRKLRLNDINRDNNKIPPILPNYLVSTDTKSEGVGKIFRVLSKSNAKNPEDRYTTVIECNGELQNAIQAIINQS